MSDPKKVAGASSSRATPPPNREQDAPATLVDAAPHWEYLNPRSEIDIRTGGNLPHWEQGSVWYFVTFRLADALPREVVEKIQQQRDQWRRTHNLNTLSRDELAEYHQLFAARYEQLLHAVCGSCVLRDPVNADVVRDALRHLDGLSYALDEFIILTKHVHVLVNPLTHHRLADILHSWKSYSATLLNRRLGLTGQLWQHESYDHIVRNEPAMTAMRRYIRDNPKVAGAS